MEFENPLLAAPGFFAVMLLLFGLILGSFLNVVIARVPEGLSIVHPRSRCPRCGHMIPWYENIPVFSWMFLRGRCSQCKLPISLRYPLIELLTGLLFLACLRSLGWTYQLVPALLMVTILVPLTFIDLDHWILPLEMTLPGIAISLLSAIPLGWDSVRDSALGAVGGFGMFLLMEFIGRWIFKKEALGGGDKWLLAMIGGFLTYQALPAVLILSSFQGAVVGIAMLALFGRAHPAPSEEPPAAAPAEPPATPTPTAEAGKPAEPAPEPPAPEPPALEPKVEGGAPALDTAAAPPAGAPPAEAGKPAEPAPEPPALDAATPPAGAKKDGELDEEEDDWVPGPTNIPLGPWLALAALEALFFGDALTALFRSFVDGLAGRLMALLH